MKNGYRPSYSSILILVSLSLLIFSCKKDPAVEEAPSVSIDSSRVDFGNSITVYGTVHSSGSSDLISRGFCLSTSPNPSESSNPGLVQVANNHFSYTYYNLDNNSTYYIRAWAKNSAGTGLSNDLKVEGMIDPVVTAPCSNPSNYIQLEYQAISYTANQFVMPDPFGFGDYTMQAGDATHPLISFKFNRMPTTGVYTTAESSSLDSISGNKVHVYWPMIQYNLGQAKLLKNASVYVVKQSDGSYHVNVCSAPYLLNNITNHLSLDVVIH